MGKAVIVRAWCDPHGEEADVEATHTDVPVQWGKITVTLDLCAEHYKLADDVMGPLVKVGTRKGKVNPGGAQRGRKPRWFYDGMQRFAAEQGIEIPVAADGKLMYPDSLRRKWDAEIARRGQEQQ